MRCVKNFLESIKQECRFASEHARFRELLALDTSSAHEEIRQTIQNRTPEEVAVFERNFLSHAVIVMGRAYKLRALQLFGYLKTEQALINGEFVECSSPDETY